MRIPYNHLNNKNENQKEIQNRRVKALKDFKFLEPTKPAQKFDTPTQPKLDPHSHLRKEIPLEQNLSGFQKKFDDIEEEDIDVNDADKNH